MPEKQEPFFEPAGPHDESLRRFLGDGPVPAGPGLWLGACVAVLASVGPPLLIAIQNHASLAYMTGTVLWSGVLPFLVAEVGTRWTRRRTQRARVKALFLASSVCALWTAVSIGTTRGYFSMDRSALRPADIQEQAVQCLRHRDLGCAQARWTEYLQLRPTDGRAMANLGMVMNMRDEHAQAVVQFQRAVEAGEGTYDLFSYYADSLTKLGRMDEAIDWSYRALEVVPTLVDVRGNLAKLLVNRQRPYEALALLQAFDERAQARGQPMYFSAQRMAIEAALGDSGIATPATKLQLPTYAGHFIAPLKLGRAPSTPFMVDTGASYTTLSTALIESSAVRYRVTEERTQATTADGRKIDAKAVILESLQLGPFQLGNVEALVCTGCASLLGQSTLRHFDLRTARVQGVEFLTLTQRHGL